MSEFIYLLASVIFVSLLSLVGVISIAVGRKRLHAFISVFVAFASGTLLAASFLHMMPEAYEEIGAITPALVLAGILFFFFIEKFIHWHHCGKEECHVRPVAYVNLIADGLHNFIDGIIIAASYLVSVPVGLVTTMAIAFHEIPQEFGDFSVLLHSGMKVKKALFYNFLSASCAIIGAIVGYFALNRVHELIPYSIAMAAGGFIYIATADLMPELHKETQLRKLIIQSIALLAGVLLLAVLYQILPDAHA